MIALAATTVTKIYTRQKPMQPGEITLLSDSTTVTYVSKQTGAPFEASAGLTCYQPLTITVQNGEEVFAYSTATPNITVLPAGGWARCGRGCR